MTKARIKQVAKENAKQKEKLERRDYFFNNWFLRTYKRKPLCHSVTEDLHIKEAFEAGFSSYEEHLAFEADDKAFEQEEKCEREEGLIPV